jgi:hypothetical protein
MNYAVIEAGRVVNIIVVDNIDDIPSGLQTELVTSVNAYIGLRFDPGTGFEQPPGPSIEDKQRGLKSIRDRSLLREVDKWQKNLVWKNLTAAQKTELETYWLALLDIENNPKFAADPDNVVFPTKPVWM